MGAPGSGSSPGVDPARTSTTASTSRAGLGTPIRAAATGVVAYVGWNPWDREGRAYIVIIGHAGGLVTATGTSCLRAARGRVGRA